MPSVCLILIPSMPLTISCPVLLLKLPTVSKISSTQMRIHLQEPRVLFHLQQPSVGPPWGKALGACHPSMLGSDIIQDEVILKSGTTTSPIPLNAMKLLQILLLLLNRIHG